MDSHISDKITQTMATDLLNSYHHMTTTLGCWESHKKPRPRGYVLVRVGPRREVGLHQVALIADNRRDELKITLGSNSFDISHICHNRKCFNPEHLVVESRRTNTRRQSCNGHKILVADDFSYHPCAHGSVEKMRKCILPVHHLAGLMQNSDKQPSTEAPPAPHLDDTATNNIAADKYDHITLTMARELINQYRAVTTDLGCWRSNLKLAYGHPLVKLTKLNVKGGLPQLSLIADNRMAELKRALGSRACYNISHLCHDTSCFNPQHSIVESKSDNRKRMDCKGKTILVCEGITYHPCVHGRVEMMHKCILPVQEVQDIVSNNDVQPSTEATPVPDLDDTSSVNSGADKYDHITPTMARELVSRHHAATTDLGC
ncbi:zinc-binding loop region of homing endonuclease-domain-containing protein [Lipomyces tetrasporus]|uniref:Zinc-binding loop region of homing endonuclease-domain-containing protein n=1 Tax=Lipomyces tetrasporus TaxID=54092 RepID=A0AAD7QV05_9ASCO|nr:zinc-binding loop region of homing endonuclease-domain-containing protein [Lipomyces tetrasporus]KAJ8101481.1 zinc-binding loop region of homing endonuclease-domain-containing protein [Lipomyces tetrasporus]